MFFAKGEINMNNIYKVIWSKAKNCYVVASEIARSHTKSASGSEKIGGVTRRSLLASLMALSLLCGGLGVASAANSTVHVDESASGAAEVYTKTGVDTLLNDYGKKTDVEDNKNNIATLRTTTTTQGQKITENATNIARNTTDIGKKIDTEMANERFATKVDLTALQNQVTGKVDENTFEDALYDKADKTYVDTEVGKKANKATTLTGYGITDAYTKDATDTAITTKVNEEKDARELKDTELSGRIDTLSTTVASKVSKTDLNTTLGNYYTQAETNAAIKTAVDDEKNARENAINGEVTSRNKAIADAIALEETNRDAAITKEETKRKEEDAKLEEKITENTTAINNEKAVREAADTDLSKRIGTVTEDGKYIKKSGTNNVSENLVELDKQAKTNADNIQTNANNIKNNKDEIARVNGELVKTNKYFNAELSKTNDYFNTELSKTNNHFNTELGKTNAALQATNKRTAGIGRTDTGVEADNQTVIEGKVHFDQNGNVSGVKDLQTDTIHATGEITSKGLDAGSGEITTKGKVSAGDVSTGTLETTGNAKIGGDLTVNGELKTDKIAMEHTGTDADGTRYNSSTTITADGITHIGEVEKSGVITKSQFTHTEEGSETYATKGDKTDWTETRSDVKADGVKTEVKDSKGNRTNTSQTTEVINGFAIDEDGNSSTTSQTAKDINGNVTDKDGNKTDMKVTATENSIQIQDKDGKNTNHQVNTMGSSVTEIKNGDGKTTKTEQTATDITNTAEQGTITNNAKDIVNNATGDMTNEVGGKLTTTVAGQATEEFNGGLNTTVTGTEKHTVNGKQINTVTGGQENIISGGQTNTITGDQTTTVTGDISNTAKNITNEATTKLTDKVGANTRVLDGEGITDTVGGSTFKQRIDAIMGNVKTADGESEVTQKGNEITSVVGKGEATNSRVTQKKGSLEAGVTDGTNTNASYDVADASAKVLTGGTKVNKLQDNLDSSEKTITNGTYTTSKVQTALDITNTAKDGTITNDAKNIVNNATGDMTNTVGGKQTNKIDGDQVNTIGGSQTTTVEGKVTENYKAGQATNVTGDQDITVSGTQTTTATDIKRNASSGMIDTIDNDYGTNTETKVAGKTTTDVSIKGTGEKGQYIRGANESRDYLIKGTLKNSETKTVEKTSTEITDGTNKASTIQDAKNLAGSVTNGTETGVSGIHANDDGSVSIDSGVTDGTNTSVQKQTASAIATDVKDGAGNENASVATATTSANTIKSGSKANTVISTADGTSFINSDAMTPVTGASGAGTAVNTTIKGNTITTGKVTMDYAQVMRDLGVNGNANIDGKTTTGSLEVKGESKLTGKVTMESDATVGGKLDVTGKATFSDDVDIKKNLSVVGDVTAKSYKVGEKTYIDENGIHANGQKITDVADGSISEGSKDAVNGGQLYNVKNDLEGKVNKVGANAAAMANLHPMEFDPDSKWNIAAAIGNYGSETAAALGAFYRPNDDVMVNLSTAFGTGENMVGGGVSVRLGKGGNKLSREETNALKAQVADLSARMDALLSVLNPNMSKDFPDVPENHWAYEAVSRLAGNDIVQGYPDGEFHGERTMTRYEMAEIIYNALSRGAEAERELVEEFKPELQAMAASEKATAEKAEG